MTTEEILDFFTESFPTQQVTAIQKLAQSGSLRQNFKITTQQQVFIATFNTNLAENKAFIYFSTHFLQQHIQVPHILAIHPSNLLYIQSFAGEDNLLDVILKEGAREQVYALLKQSITMLANMQIKASEHLDYNYCVAHKQFNQSAFLADMLYFKYYFLDIQNIAYNKEKLMQEFDLFASYLQQVPANFFMFRDFQSRNIMVNDKRTDVTFIDYQGGMQGPLQYDIASLLWQAKANLSPAWKESLLQDYLQAINQYLPNPVNAALFIQQYHGFVLLRLLQVLGAYGFRGLLQKKEHFIQSIPLALQQLKQFIASIDFPVSMPELYHVLQKLTETEIIQRFTPIQATENTVLTISINSFSYKKGLPTDHTSNGGGYIFDMRGILNPGRYEPYKTLSGRDEAVQLFLEEKTKMPAMLQSIWEVLSITVENYIERNFEHLQINFGCTGGQHRSVYAAEQTAQFLQRKHKVKVQLQHCNQANWVTQ